MKTIKLYEVTTSCYWANSNNDDSLTHRYYTEGAIEDEMIELGDKVGEYEITGIKCVGEFSPEKIAMIEALKTKFRAAQEAHCSVNWYNEIYVNGTKTEADERRSSKAIGEIRIEIEAIYSELGLVKHFDITAKADELELSYDVHYDNSVSSNCEGFESDYQYCKDYIDTTRRDIGSYFEDYEGGVVSIVATIGRSETITVFESEI